MTSLTRSVLPSAALAAALTALVTGCGSVSTTAAGAASSPSAPAASASVSVAKARVVYLAESGSVGGTVVHAPDCKTGCPLSGDGTTSLWDMTWRTWDSAVAAGSGTEKLDDCTPDCATGTLHAVPVSVVLSRPAMLCVSGTGRWFWTRVSFTWPAGLPAAFSGGNAPVNPFDYTDITAQSAKSCP